MQYVAVTWGGEAIGMLKATGSNGGEPGGVERGVAAESTKVAAVEVYKEYGQECISPCKTKQATAVVGWETPKHLSFLSRSKPCRAGAYAGIVLDFTASSDCIAQQYIADMNLLLVSSGRLLMSM